MSGRDEPTTIAALLSARISEAVGPLVQLLDEWHRIVSGALESPGFVAAAQRIAEQLAVAGADLEEMKESDFPYRWVSSASLGFLLSTYRDYRRGDVAAGAEAMCAHVGGYGTHRKMVSEMRKRTPMARSADVMRDALWAHRHRRYTLSIPVLIAQIEACARRMTPTFESRGRDERPVSKVFRDLRGKRRFFTPFASFLTGQHSRQRRDPILHGNNAAYASEQLSVECILAVNELLYASGGDGVFRYD